MHENINCGITIIGNILYIIPREDNLNSHLFTFFLNVSYKIHPNYLSNWIF